MPVASNFQEMRDRVVGDVDQRLAEPVFLSFLRDGRVDPERPAATIEAVLRVGSDDDSKMTGGKKDEWRMRLRSGEARLAIDMTLYTGPIIRSGDKVRALSRKGQPWFAVNHVDDRGHSRLICHLGEK